MKLKILLVLCMLVLVGSVAGFTSCPSDAGFEDAIRQAIVNYFNNPNEENLNILKDLVEFYSTHDLSTADCSEVGENSGVEIQDAYKGAENVSEVVEGQALEKDVSLADEIFSWVDDLLHSEWISNNIIGITLHSWSSDDFQFPLGSNNLYSGGGMRFAVRYNNNVKWSHDGWIGSSIQILPVTEDLHFTESTNERKVAVGKVADSNVEIKTEATLLKDKKWMLIKYTLKNKGSSAVNNVKFYHGADFDVKYVTSSDDYGSYDPNLKLLYEWDNDGSPYVGFASTLNPTQHDVSNYRTIWNRINSDSLAGGNSYGIGDAGIAFSWEFGTLNPGQTKEIPIILATGTNLNDLKTEIQEGLNYAGVPPQLQVEWIYPAYTEMSRNYNIIARVTNPSTETQTVNLALDETRVTPISIDWNLDDQRQWQFEGQPYYGQTIQRTIGPGATVDYIFTVNHHWNWIRPWDLKRFYEAVKSIFLALPLFEKFYLLPEGINALQTFLTPVDEITYLYEGVSDSESSSFETTLTVPWNKYVMLGESVVANSLGGKSTIAGFGVLLTPGIGPGVAVPFFVAEASYFTISELLYISAVDPSEDYTEIAVPEPIAVSEICGIDDLSAREISETSFNLLAVSEAMKDSYIRYDAAEDANSTEWMAVQLSMVQNYASEMTRVTSELKSLIEPNLEGVAIPTEEEIQEIKQNISEFGLPEIEVCALTALGYTQEEIEQVKNATLDFPDNYFVYFVDIPDVMDNVNEGLMNFSEALPPLPEDVIVATIDIDPDTLNLKSKGDWITAYIELSENYDVSNIDISTVTLNGVVPAENNPKYGFVKNVKSRIGDYDSDGIPDSIVKFKRSDVQGTLEAGKEGLAVTGQLSDGTVFGGVDTVRVI